MLNISINFAVTLNISCHIEQNGFHVDEPNSELLSQLFLGSAIW